MTTRAATFTARSALALALALVSLPSVARAGGFELLPGGARSAARGGAVAARPEDAMAMLHNPAGIALLAHDQFTFDIDVAQFDMCADLYGYYGWGVYEDGVTRFGDQLAIDDPEDPTIGATYATTPLPEICNSAPLLPLPQIAWLSRLTDRLTLGIGFVAPTVVTGARYGGNDGTIDPRDYEGLEYPDGLNALPTPTRYQLIEQRVTQAFAPSVAFAYRVMPQLALGVNLQLIVLSATARSVQNGNPGTQASTDWLTDATAEDFFLPALTASVHTRPLRGLDVMAAFRWMDDFSGDGEVRVETATYHSASGSGNDPVPFRNDASELSSVHVGLPWVATVGVRYAWLLPELQAKPLGDHVDPLGEELWDVELDLSFAFNARASKSSAEAGEDLTVVHRHADGSGTAVVWRADDLATFSIDRHLEDSIAIRLGGSYSLLPKRLQLHAGGFFETRGVDPAYLLIDGFAMQRFGASAGLMVRFGSLDLIAGYTHIFQDTVEVAPPPHESVDDVTRQDVAEDSTRGFDKRVGGTFADDGTRDGGVVLEDPDAPAPSEADAVARFQPPPAPGQGKPERIINAGKYSAAFNVLSVGMIYHF